MQCFPQFYQSVSVHLSHFYMIILLYCIKLFFRCIFILGVFLLYCKKSVFLTLYLIFIVFGVEPDLTREGGSIPVTLTLQEATGRNVMLLPVGSSDDGAHSQNEKLNRYF